MPTKRNLMRILVPLGILVLFLSLAETGLRAFEFEYPREQERKVLWNREADRTLRAGAGLHEIDPYEMWKPRAGAAIPWTTAETINADGMRGPAVPRERRAGVKRIALFGSDSTFGSGVAWHETWACQLPLDLAQLGVEAEVLCAGVMQSTLRQGLERYRHLVREWAPDVVVCAYSGDCEYLPAPRCTTDTQQIEGGRAAQMQLAAAADRAGGTSFDPRDDLRTLHAGAWLSALTIGTYWNERDQEMREKRFSRSIHSFDVAGVRRVSLAEFKGCLQTFGDEVRADGATLLLMVIPPKTRFGKSSPVLDVYGQMVADYATKAAAPLITPRDEFLRVMLTGVVLEDLYIVGTPSAPGTHISPRAHALLAQVVAKQVLALPQ